MALSITGLLLTHNEEANLSRTLERLRWLGEVLVLDSGSTDRTVEIARSFPNVRLETRAFDSFAGQCNHGLQRISSEWVLSLDADYVLSDTFIAEVQQLEPGPAMAGYRSRFRYCIHGRPLRASLYPPRAVLYRRAAARYEDEGHGHRVRLAGEVRDLAGWIDHDDRKPLSRWLAAQVRYLAREADHLLASDPATLGRADRLRLKMWPAPPAALLYTLFWKRLILDGWPGWFYAFQRTYAELLLSLILLERKVQGGSGKPVISKL